MNVHKATIYSSITSFFKSSWISEHRQRRCHQWSWCIPAHRHHSSLWQTKIHNLLKILKFDIVTFVLLSPSFFAFWTDIIFPPSRVQTAVTSLPSGVVSSKGSPSCSIKKLVFSECYKSLPWTAAALSSGLWMSWLSRHPPPLWSHRLGRTLV